MADMNTAPAQVLSQAQHLGPKVYILDVKKYNPEIPLQFKLPDGEIVKDATIDVDGYVTPTFSGFTPAPAPFGIMDAIIGKIEVATDGNKTRKSFRRPETLHRYTRLVNAGSVAQRKFKTNATALGDSPSIGNYAFGTTGQSIAFAESAAISFQNKLSSDWSRTLLDLRGMTSSYLTINPKGFSGLNTAAVGGGSFSVVGDINVRVSITTWPAMAGQVPFVTWLQTVKEERINGATDNQKISLPVGLGYQGIYCVAERQSDGKRVNWDEAKNIIFSLYRNETELLYRVSLATLMSINENKLEMEIFDDGAAYMDLLSNNVFETMTDTRDSASIRSLHMSVSTPLAINVYLETDCIAAI